MPAQPRFLVVHCIDTIGAKDVFRKISFCDFCVSHMPSCTEGVNMCPLQKFSISLWSCLSVEQVSLGRIPNSSQNICTTFFFFFLDFFLTYTKEDRVV